MSKIFITGSTGSIGKLLKEVLLRDGCEVIEPANLKARIENEDYFHGIQNPDSIDVLYHLAANIFVPKSWEEPVDFIHINVLGTTRVLEFCRAHNIKLVFVSSYVYGNPLYLPIDEKHPVQVTNPYALSKKLAEDVCIFYGENFGLSYNIIRPFNVFGIDQKKELLVPFIIDQIKNSTEIKVFDLAPKRDYILIDEVIDFLTLAKSKFTNGIFNLGTGQSYSVAEIIETCQEVWGTNLPVSSTQTSRKNEINETRADISKIEKEFKWKPKHDLKEGLEIIKQRELS